MVMMVYLWSSHTSYPNQSSMVFLVRNPVSHAVCITYLAWHTNMTYIIKICVDLELCNCIYVYAVLQIKTIVLYYLQYATSTEDPWYKMNSYVNSPVVHHSTVHSFASRKPPECVPRLLLFFTIYSRVIIDVRVLCCMKSVAVYIRLVLYWGSSVYPLWSMYSWCIGVLCRW